MIVKHAAIAPSSGEYRLPQPVPLWNAAKAQPPEMPARPVT